MILRPILFLISILFASPVLLAQNYYDHDCDWAHDSNRLEFMKTYFNPNAKRLEFKDLNEGLSQVQKNQFLDILGINSELRAGGQYDLIDLNNDGYLDVISNSSFGAEGPILQVWLNVNNRLSRVIYNPLGILQLVAKNEVSTELLVYNSGYFGSTTATIQSYKFEGGEIKTDNVQFQILTKFPIKSSFITDFQVNNEDYNLRFYPETKDWPCEEQMSPDDLICGSKYITLNSKTFGSAYSSSIDETGRVWWFSVITTSNELYPKQLGWVSSRFVTKK